MFFRLFAFVLLFGLPATLRAETYPPHTEDTVYDFADLLSPAQEERLRETIADLRADRDVAFVVVTMNTMQDYKWYGEIEPYATKLFNTWGIGDADKDNGILMLVAKNDRQMRIELGEGFSFLWNGRMQQVIDTNILPMFRNSQYPAGIINGVDGVAAMMETYLPARDAGFFARLWPALLLFFVQPAVWITGVIGTALGAPIAAFRRQRRKPRHCPVDGSKMVRLEEEWDDNKLQPGQLTEERIGSVDYDVWQCQQCNHVTIEGYKAWFSGYGACRECGFKTVQGDEHVTVQPTYTSTGTAEVDYHCAHCNARYSVTRTIPKRERNESSGSSGGSSFGGGSSSGGGASGRW
jgi:uncharacterized protein